MKIFILILCSILSGCKSNSTRQAKLAKVELKNIFRFDSTAIVYGCADVYLQKFSRNLKHELLVQLVFENIPKYKLININDYSKSVNIYYNEFLNDNKYIDPICNDVPSYPKDWKAPKKYKIVSGNLVIKYWSEKENVVSVKTSNLIGVSETNDTILIPLESFDSLHVHWFGG